MTEDQKEQIRKLHKTSLPGIRDILIAREIHCKWPFILALMLAVLCCIFFCAFPEYSFKGVKELVDVITSYFPSLLGFTLAGYTLLVGFPNLDLIEQDSETSKHSLYQVLSGFFAATVLLQVVCTGMAFLINWIIKIDIPKITDLECISVFYTINVLVLFILTLISSFSIFLTPYIILNLFSLSQVNSTFLTVKRIAKEDDPGDDQKP